MGVQLAVPLAVRRPRDRPELREGVSAGSHGLRTEPARVAPLHGRDRGRRGVPARRAAGAALRASLGEVEVRRSEEHTSELQSPYDLVCRLLLEKKKKNTQHQIVPGSKCGTRHTTQ